MWLRVEAIWFKWDLLGRVLASEDNKRRKS